MARASLLFMFLALFCFSACDESRAGGGTAANSPLSRLIFFQDSRAAPAICYAYMWGGMANGGPALAAVPCEIVAGRLADPSTDRTAADILKKIRYLEDARTGPALCYAYIWGGMANGGPALTSVPCDAVEKLLERFD